MMDDRPAPGRQDLEAAALARLYDVDLLDDPGDLDLYLALAARAGDPILELAVGTGRLAVPLAVAGHAVTGVDLDAAMLGRARLRAAEASVGGRLTLVEGDMASCRLEQAGSYRLAFIALNSIMLLRDRRAQAAAVRTLAEHLAPGGIAVVDTWLPGAADLARFDGRMGLEYVRRDPDTGWVVTKLASAGLDSPAQAIDLVTIFEEGPPGEPAGRWIRQDRLRMVSVDELTDLAEAAGLVVEEVAGDYGLTPIGPESERAILIARRP